uniref:thiol oxidase n=1 Tax=viral metagenome TaxID=1070528 RepID=A0A6C0LVE6_9ZZZZ
MKKSYSKSGQVYPCPLPKSLPKSKKRVSINEPYTMKIKYTHLDNANTGNPAVWGPAMWFSLHNGAYKYPKKASPFWKNRMKSFIQGIPVMLPCEVCADHACAYIESQKHYLEEVVSGRENLIIFFVNFHNFVNRKLGKPEMSLKDVNKMFSGTSDVLTVEWGPA